MTIKELYRIFLKYPNVSTDSRRIIPESLFFALKGDNFNGNQYAADALEKGAAFAIIDEPKYNVSGQFILVSNVLKTLQLLAAHHRQQMPATIIGITGTNGKTTTKELISAILSSFCSTLYTQGNLNNHIGVPLTLLQLKPEHKMAVIEMGANHSGDIRELCDIAVPDAGIITNIGKAHIQGFGSVENIIKTKSELYDSLENNQGIAFYHADNKILSSAIRPYTFQKIAYGNSPDSLIACNMIASYPFLELVYQDVTIKSNLFGAYNYENILAAICIAQYYGVPKEIIKTAIESYKPSNNRSQLSKTPNNTLILDMYNANPSSMEKSIQNFAGYQAENKALILGDMLELGESSAKEHDAICKLIADSGINNVFLVGSEFQATTSNYNTYRHVDELILWLKNNPLKNYTILIKGSRGIKLEKVIEFL